MEGTVKNCDPKQAIGTKSHLDVEAVKALEQPWVRCIFRERRTLANRRSHLVRINRRGLMDPRASFSER